MGQETEPGDAPVLVAYASRHGATAGIAGRITDRLRHRGIRVAIVNVGDVERIDDCRAVVLGSPVYDSRWPPEMDEFVRAHAAALASRPLWLFSVGSSGDAGRMTGWMVRLEPRGIRRIRRTLRPRDYRVFAGRIERHQWPWYARLFHRLTGGHFGDLREWPVIDAWAEGIAEDLAA